MLELHEKHQKNIETIQVQAVKTKERIRSQVK